MANGAGPPILSDADYQTIKRGTAITEGTYKGCIRVRQPGGYVFYWVTPVRGVWILSSGVPDASQCEIPDEGVWEKCKHNGSLDWDSENEWWENGEASYRWAGEAGGTVSLEEL